MHFADLIRGGRSARLILEALGRTESVPPPW